MPYLFIHSPEELREARDLFATRLLLERLHLVNAKKMVVVLTDFGPTVESDFFDSLPRFANKDSHRLYRIMANLSRTSPIPQHANQGTALLWWTAHQKGVRLLPIASSASESPSPFTDAQMPLINCLLACYRRETALVVGSDLDLMKKAAAVCPTPYLPQTIAPLLQLKPTTGIPMGFTCTVEPTGLTVWLNHKNQSKEGIARLFTNQALASVRETTIAGCLPGRVEVDSKEKPPIPLAPSYFEKI